MKPLTFKPILGLLLVLSSVAAHAAIQYWDINGATAGAGGATPGGAWTGSNWSTDPAGAVATTTFTSGDSATFSAGADATGTYIVSGNATVSAITNEEGKVVISGTLTLGSGPITINSGATLSTSSSIRISATAGSVMTINGGTAESTNPGSAGSFVDIDQVIVLNGGGTISHTVAGVLNIVQTTTTISGTGPLTKEGAGILAIASACTYSGATIINNGTLRMRTSTNRLPTGTDVTINSPGVFDPAVSQTVRTVNGNGAITYSGNGTLTINGGSGANSTIAGIISDDTSFGRITKSGAGILTLSGVNTYDGTFTLSAGTCNVDPVGKLCGPLCDVAVNGGTLNLSNTVQFIENLSGTGGTINLAPGHTLTSLPAASTTNSSIIAGSGAFTLNSTNGANTLTLSKTNTYAGNTTITAGTIKQGTNSAIPGGIGKGNVSVTGTLDVGGFVCVINGLSGAGTVDNSTGAGTLSVGNNDQTSTFSGVIQNTAGTLALTKTGTGILTLTGANTYNGSTTVNAGRLVTTPASIGAGSYSVDDGATLETRIVVPGTTLNMSDLTLGTAGATTMEFDFASLGYPTANVVTDSGAIAVNGAVSVNVKGFNTAGGPVTLLEHAGARAGAGSFVPGALPPHVVGTITDDTANKKVVLNVTAADSLIWVGDATGNWDTNNPANSIWKLASDNSANYYQETAVQGDVVLFDDTLTGTNTVNLTTNLIPFRVTVNNPTTNYTFSGPGKISGVGTLTKSGAGTLTIMTANNYTGGSTLNAGTLAIGNSTVLGTGKFTINGGSIRSDSATARTLSTAVDLNSDLALGDASIIGDLTFSTGAWKLVGASRQINVETINATINSVIGEDVAGRALTKAGNGTLSLGAANTFSGGFNHNSGTVRVNNNTALGAADSTVNLANGVTLSTTGGTGRTLTYAFNVNGNITLGQVSGGTAAVTMAGSVNLAGANRTFTVVNATDTISGVITNGGIIKEGTGILSISGAANLYSGPTTINAGQISVSGTSVLGDGTGALNLAGGKLTSTASRDVTTAPIPNPISLTVDSAITTSSAATTVDLNLSGTPSGSAGTLTFRNDGANGAGDTFEPRFSAGGFNFSRPIVIDNGAFVGAATRLSFFNVSPSVQTFSGVISGNGSIRRSASTAGTGGTTIFTEANTYSGATTINDGTLLVNNTTGSGTGSGTVTVNSGGALGGTGTVSAVVVNSGGSVGAGASVGLLTITNGLNLSAGGTNVWELGADTTAGDGVNFDQISLTGGNLALGGSSMLLIKFIGTATVPDPGSAFWQSARQWKIISLSGSAGNAGLTTFANIDGTNGITAGTFSTSVDPLNGHVFLDYTPAAAPVPAPQPQIISIDGVGTATVTVTWTNTVVNTNYVLQFNTNNLDMNYWSNLAAVTATGSTASQTDNPPAGEAARFYRVLVP